MISIFTDLKNLLKSQNIILGSQLRDKVAMLGGQENMIFPEELTWQ